MFQLNMCDFGDFVDKWKCKRFPKPDKPHATSKVEQEWIEVVAKLFGINIQCAGSSQGQKRCGRYSFDGYYENPNGEKWIFEFMGDYHHSWVGKYDLFQPHPKYKKLHGEIYYKTLLRLLYLLERGYKVFVCWEWEYREWRKRSELEKMVKFGEKQGIEDAGVALQHLPLLRTSSLPGHWVTISELESKIKVVEEQFKSRGLKISV